MTESKLSNGTKTSFTYDAANQTKGLVNVNSTNTTLSYYNYQFDGVGDRTSLWDNGVDVSNWNYDCTGQLTNDTSRPAATALNWNGLTVDQWNVLNVSGWDNLLVDHVPTGGAGMLEYSPTGNRLTQTDPVTGDVTTFTYDNANRLLTAVDVSGTTTYTYDANGNQETIEEPSGDITTNTWNGDNRLVRIEHPDGTETNYRYNGDGLRVAEDHDGTVTLFVYDGNNRLQETDDVGTVEAEYTYLPLPYAEVLSQRRDMESSFYLCDGIRNIRQLTDGSQSITDEYSFDAWGILRSSTGSTANSQLYKGHLLSYRNDPHAGPDTQTSTHFRNQSAKTGRFTSEDPAADDHNLYRPVGNNLVNGEDPSGLQQGSPDAPLENQPGYLHLRGVTYWGDLLVINDKDVDSFIAWTSADRLLQLRNQAAETFLPRDPVKTLELLRSGAGVYFLDSGGPFPRKPDPDWAPTLQMLRLLKSASLPEGGDVQFSGEVVYEGSSDEPRVTRFTLSDADQHWLNDLSDKSVADCLNLEALKRAQVISVIEYELEKRRVEEMAINTGLAVASTAYEPIDWLVTFSFIAQDPSNPLAYAGLLPLVPANSKKLIGSPNAAIIRSFDEVTGQNASKLSKSSGVVDEVVAPRVVDAWALRHTDITARLKEHLSHAVKQAKLTPAQARDVIKNGRASTHWGTQIDTRFKELVQNDPLLRGEVAVSPRSLPKGSGAPDVIDLRSKRWWDVTSTAEEFAKKPAKYGTQFGDGTSLLYGEP